MLGAGGATVGVDVGGTRVAVGGTLVAEGDRERVGVGVGGTGVPEGEGGCVGVEVGAARVAGTVGAAYTGDDVGVGEACDAWPTVTFDVAYGPTFPRESVALA
jgi:hypothetical protein